jgi:hypothetical protein
LCVAVPSIDRVRRGPGAHQVPPQDQVQPQVVKSAAKATPDELQEHKMQTIQKNKKKPFIYIYFLFDTDGGGGRRGGRLLRVPAPLQTTSCAACCPFGCIQSLTPPPRGMSSREVWEAEAHLRSLLRSSGAALLPPSPALDAARHRYVHPPLCAVFAGLQQSRVGSSTHWGGAGCGRRAASCC